MKNFNAKLIDLKSGRPLPNIPVEAVAEKNGKKFSLGVLFSDRQGLVSFSPDKTLFSDDLEHIWVSPLNENKKTDVLPQIKNSPQMKHIPITFDKKPKNLEKDLNQLGFKEDFRSIQDLEAVDLSSLIGSFSTKPDLKLGKGGCEEIVPSELSRYEYRFNKVLRLTNEGGGVDEVKLTNLGESPDLVAIRGVLQEFKMSWIPLGHSLGDLIYSLPLAPCEVVKLAIVDWSREDTAQREEEVELKESLIHELKRDRTVDESVAAMLKEYQKGSNAQAGFSLTGAFDSIGFSLAGGGTTSSTTGRRNLNAQTQQDLVDAITQSTGAVRRLRTTVVVKSTQKESEVLETRVVRNHNHCHTLTILYYAVLKHYEIVTRWVKDRKIILVPYEIKEFDRETIFCHRSILQDGILDPSIVPAFDAIERLEETDLSSNSSSPTIHALDFSNILKFGHFLEDVENNDMAKRIFMSVTTGDASDVAEGLGDDVKDFLDTAKLGTPLQGLQLGLKFKDNSEIFWDLENHIKTFGTTSNRGLRPDSSSAGPFGTIGGEVTDRDEGFEKYLAENTVSFFEFNLPPILLREIKSFKVIVPIRHPNKFWVVRSLKLSYSTTDSKELIPFFSKSGLIFTDNFDNGFLNPSIEELKKEGEKLFFEHEFQAKKTKKTPAPNQKRPTTESRDKLLEKKLLKHLNCHKLYYNQLLWLAEDSNERILRFDQFRSINGSGRFIDDIENRPVGVFGNHLAFLERESEIQQSEQDSAQTPEPSRTVVALPARGVFAEAKLGHCNGCEEIDETRFWDWQQSPCPDEAPGINDLTAGGKNAPTDVTPSSLPNSVVNIVSPPQAPDPTGLSSAIGALATPNIFRDLSGSSELTSLLNGLAQGSLGAFEAQQKAKQITQNNSSNNQIVRPSAKELGAYRNTLKKLVEDGFLTQEQANAALAQMLGIEKKKNEPLVNPSEKQILLQLSPDISGIEIVLRDQDSMEIIQSFAVSEGIRLESGLVAFDFDQIQFDQVYLLEVRRNDQLIHTPITIDGTKLGDLSSSDGEGRSALSLNLELSDEDHEDELAVIPNQTFDGLVEVDNDENIDNVIV